MFYIGDDFHGDNEMNGTCKKATTVLTNSAREFMCVS